MSGATLLTLVLIGLAAGFLGGMIGLGGAIILIPAMVLFLAMDQRVAQGTLLKKIFAVVLAIVAAKMVFTK